MATTNYSWQRMENEPAIWYDRFTRYFLPLGPTRTLIRAAFLEVSINRPKEVDGFNTNTAPLDWERACKKWEWRERADVYDDAVYSDTGVIQVALQTLRQNSLDAVKALHESLGNPRLAVAAAKEILDRAGLPAVSRLEVSAVGFTADDFRAAEEEIEQWENEMSKKSKESSG